MYTNYNNMDFAPNVVIAALRKNLNYFNTATLIINQPIFDIIKIEKIEILLHISHPDNNQSGTSIRNMVGDVLLIYLKENNKQAVIDVINVIKSDPGIVYAEPDYFMDFDLIPNDPYYVRLWGMNKINAPNAWNEYTGNHNVIVGVIDSGIYYNHTDLQDNMWSNMGWDFYYNRPNPIDTNNHGTHVAGTIGAVGNNSIGVTGVNWTIQLAGLKISSNSDRISSTAAIKAVNYANEYNMPFINGSWGGRFYCESLKEAIEEYKGLFIASSGNSAVNNDLEPHFPASYDCNNIISVAATNQNDELASFSNYGEISVDIAAPGVDIYSPTVNNQYSYKSGTSMAAPHIAGAAALLKSHRPNLTSSDIKAIILNSADKIPSLNGKVVTGGRLNLDAMFRIADNFL